MAQFIYSAGTPKFADSTQSSGTRTELVDLIKAFLTTTTGGFSVISGASGDWHLRSTATPLGHQFGIRVVDLGGNCARIYLGNNLNTVYTTHPLYLLPGAGKVWRMWSNGYSAFIWVQSSAAAREAASFGTLYVESFNLTALAPPVVAWGNAAAINDGDSRIPAPANFRTRLDSGLNGSPDGNPIGQILVGGTIASSDGGNMVGSPCLFVPAPGTETRGSATYQGPKYADGSYYADAAWIGFDILGTMNGGDPRIGGRLYDAHVTSDPQAAETTKTLDGKTWIAYTNQNLGISGSHYSGTLWLRTS